MSQTENRNCSVPFATEKKIELYAGEDRVDEDSDDPVSKDGLDEEGEALLFTFVRTCLAEKSVVSNNYNKHDDVGDRVEYFFHRLRT